MPRRRKIPVFVSYAAKNAKIANDLLDRFRDQAYASKNYNYVFWSDSEILIGEDWHKSIQEALKKCKLGILLVSPAFLGSEYISKNELPKFLGNKAKPVIPILLQTVDFDLQNLKGLKKKQFFRPDRASFIEIKAYTKYRGETQKDEYAHKLFKKVEQRLNRIYTTKIRPTKSKKGVT